MRFSDGGNDDARQILNEALQRIPLLDMGISAPVSLLVQNLIDCGEEPRPEDAYESLEGAIRDLRELVVRWDFYFLIHDIIFLYFKVD